MNLKDITEEINSALDYNPDLEAYKSQVARVVNRHYLQISSQYNWLFRQKRVPLTLRSDINGKTTTDSEGTVTNNNVLSVGNSTDSFDASNVMFFTGDSNALPTYEMLGNVLVVKDNDTFTSRSSISHGASEREFTITGIFDVSSSTSDYGSSGRYGGTGSPEWPDGYQPGDHSGIILDRPIIDPSTDDGSSLTTKDFYTDWTIEFRQYYLPPDCVEVLGIVDRGLKTPVHSESGSSISTSVNTAPDRGRLIFVDSAKEEQLYLDRDSTGDPVIGIEGMPRSISAPMIPPKVIKAEGYYDVEHAGEDPRYWGGLGRGVTYEWCYTFVYGGIESPPSPILKYTVPDGEGIYVSVLIHSEPVEGEFQRDGSAFRTESSLDGRNSDDVSADSTRRMTGRIKRFYRRRVEGSDDNEVARKFQGFQRWIHIGDHFTDGYVWDHGRKQQSTSTKFPTEFTESLADIDVLRTPALGWPQSHFLKNGQWTYHDGELQKLKVLDESGPRQTIRVYRPPSQDMDVEIRYLSRPKRLVADSDAPEWPVQYHHLLVYMALADICLQHGMSTQAQLYDRKSTELLDRMKQKYLSRTNRKYIRRGFDRVLFAGERFGVPTKV